MSQLTNLLSESWVNLPGTTAFRGVTGDILEQAFLVAAWADFWWVRRLKGIAAVTALPEGIDVVCLAYLVLFVHSILPLYFFKSITALDDRPCRSAF